MSREINLETSLTTEIENDGGLCLKVVTVGRRGFPDRLVLLPYVHPFLLELKALGEELDAHQVRVHLKLRRLGIDVVAFDGERVWRAE